MSFQSDGLPHGADSTYPGRTGVPGSLVGVTYPRAKGPVMATRRALVVGTGVAGLATAYRLRRSDWDVVLLDAPTQCAFTRTAAGLDAARRLGLPLGPDLATVLRRNLGDSVSYRVAEVRALSPDDCGVTVTFSNGDDWFDFVTEPSPDFDTSLALVAAEMLGDALDIFHDTDEALRWWEENLQPFSGRCQPPTWMPGRRSGSGSLARMISRTTGAVSPRPSSR